MSHALRYILDGGPLTVRTSTITGRSIQVNADVERFVLLPGWRPAKLAAARADFEHIIRHGRGADTRYGGGGPTPPTVQQACLAMCEPVLAAESRAALLSALDLLLAAYWARSTNRSVSAANNAITRVGWMLTLLWKHGLIVAPCGEIGTEVLFPAKTLPAFDTTGYGAAVPLILDVTDAPGRTRRGTTDRTPYFRCTTTRILLATQGVTEIGDLDVVTLEVMKPVFTGTRKNNSLVRAPGLILDAIHRSQQRTYDREVPPLRALLPGRGKKAKDGLRRADPEFRWMARDLPNFPLWQESAVRWATQQEVSLRLGAACEVLGRLIAALLEAPDAPEDPLDFCHTSFDGAARISSYFGPLDLKLSTAVGHLRRLTSFFDSVLVARVKREDGSIDPTYHNPTRTVKLKKRRRHRPGQTHRTPVRPWLVREIREILSTDEWARQLDDDYFVYTDPTSGLERRVWSPVRLEVFRLRFQLPLRTLQVQLLDSGEGDSRIWRADPDAPLGGEWLENDTPWSPPAGVTRQLGILRPIYDPDLGRDVTGLYVNTNKTGDVATEFEKLGYEIPWESADVISLVLRMRAWQERYNPTRGPLKRTDLKTIGVPASQDVAALLPAHHYLFRDPCNSMYPMEPIGSNRIRRFWVRLLDECERRLNARLAAGDPTGRAVTLITKRAKSGLPLVARYDLHSLRVTGLTELAVNGCPVQVLMMLAGHATWVMTLYYVKPSPSDVHRELNAARERAQESMDAETWEQVIGSGELDALRALPLGNSNEGIAARGDWASDLWRYMDYGECPNGGTLCDVGGEVIYRNPRDGDRHGPVEGGQRNCTSCRFFTYTPLHLLGLIARANAQLLEVQESATRLRAAERSRRELFGAAAGDTPVARKRQSDADAAVEEAEARAVAAAKAFQATHRCIARAKAALHREIEAKQDGTSSARQLPVLLNGSAEDLRLSFERCTDYDLWTRICEDSEIFPSVDPAPAALRRSIRLDRMLAQAGEGTVFAALTDEEQVAYGNMYSRWLRTKLGPVDHEGLVRGERTLRDLGIVSESDRLLAPLRAKVAPAPTLTLRPALALPAGAPALAGD